MKLILRIRDEPRAMATVWLIHKDGPAQSGLLYGTMLADRAIKLAETLGLPVERAMPLGDSADPDMTAEKIAQRQGELFAESSG